MKGIIENIDVNITNGLTSYLQLRLTRYDKRSLMATVICLFILFLSTPTSADKGMIPVYHVDLDEPEQNAIIGWNGSEEVLILSTNVKASNESLVIELLPLPSKPHIEEAEMISFRMVENYVNMKMEPEYPGFFLVLVKAENLVSVSCLKRGLVPITSLW